MRCRLEELVHGIKFGRKKNLLTRRTTETYKEWKTISFYSKRDEKTIRHDSYEEYFPFEFVKEPDPHRRGQSGMQQVARQHQHSD